MSGAVIPFEPGAALARVTATSTGFQLDRRSPRVARRYDVTSAGEAAEFAVLMRDEGGRHLRFREGADEVRMRVAEIDAETRR